LQFDARKYCISQRRIISSHRWTEKLIFYLTPKLNIRAMQIRIFATDNNKLKAKLICFKQHTLYRESIKQKHS